MSAPTPVAARAALVGDQLIVQIADTGVSYPMNASAAAIWGLCDGNREVDEIVDAIAELFDVENDDVRDEVVRALDRFVGMGLLGSDSPSRAASPPSPVDAQRFGTSVDLELRDATERAIALRGSWSDCQVWVDDDGLAAFIADRCRDLDVAGARDVTTGRIDIAREVGADDEWYFSRNGGSPRGDGSGRAAIVVELLNSLTFDSEGHRPVTLHGAAAEHGGRVVVLTGGWHVGKTSTLLHLLQAGWGYVADEIVTIDPQTRMVQPRHNPLVLARSDWAERGVDPIVPAAFERFVGDPIPVPASIIPSVNLTGGGRLGALVVVSLNSGGGCVLDTLPLADSLPWLVANLLPPHRQRPAWFRELVTLAASVPVLRLRVDDGAEVPDLLAAALAEPFDPLSVEFLDDQP